MEYLTISKFSVIAPLISGDGISVNEKVAKDFREIRAKAKSNCVEIHFFDDSVRIIGQNSRKMKVPAKCVKSAENLIIWLNERIKKAWN